MNANAHIETRLAGVPPKPGVYMMRDANDDVIYVGKAVVLRNRVRSYFQESASHTPKTRRLVSEIDDLEWIVTESELEALILESQLIKRYKPRYNVRLKDDKRYPYIKVSVQEDFPRIYMVRKMMQDGARYFGPFASSRAVRQSLDLLRRLFPYRTCDREITGHDSRPCLYYHIGRCGGPCIGAVGREEYRATIERACLFLEGKQEQIIEEMRGKMEDAAEALDFETAAHLRDQISAIEHIIQQQRIVSGHLKDHDFIAFARDEREACVQVFFVRGGRLIGREYFLLSGVDEEDDAEIMTSFVKQFYDEAAQVPPEILVQSDLDELAVIQRWLRRKRGDKVLIKVPRRGEKEAVMRMAVENAVETLKKVRAEWDADTNKQTQALAELQEALDLEHPPTRIECYDISNTQGVATTGSRVVFVKGVPSKQDYRRFRVRTVHGPDDYAAMAEVLQRRFKRAHEAQARKREEGKESRWAIMPDLVLLDGGKGQLNAARQVMVELGVDHIPTAALAKREEALFVPGRAAPILLPRRSEALYLLQRIRDEAHRFAISYHRKLRRKKGMNSILEEIPGVGPVRRQSLLKTFGSLEGIRKATVEELAVAPGMNRPVAERLKEYL
ncbi:MAG: excinuclease ABC subunit UvrC [Chloroflexota bacterium]|nr:excinuclease ABC subunit UvrC [Chloroflexota bacterium]